jgi:hypothetical protein
MLRAALTARSNPDPVTHQKEINAGRDQEADREGEVGAAGGVPERASAGLVAPGAAVVAVAAQQDVGGVDGQTAGRVRAALEKIGTPIGAYDLLIAGQALRRGLTVVTANTSEFSRVAKLSWEDWTI